MYLTIEISSFKIMNKILSRGAIRQITFLMVQIQFLAAGLNRVFNMNLQCSFADGVFVFVRHRKKSKIVFHKYISLFLGVVGGNLFFILKHTTLVT